MTLEELREERAAFQENIRQQYAILDERERELEVKHKDLLVRLKEIEQREERVGAYEKFDIVDKIRTAVGLMHQVAKEVQGMQYNLNIRDEKIKSLQRELGRLNPLGDANGKPLHN